MLPLDVVSGCKIFRLCCSNEFSANFRLRCFNITRLVKSTPHDQNGGGHALGDWGACRQPGGGAGTAMGQCTPLRFGDGGDCATSRLDQAVGLE